MLLKQHLLYHGLFQIKLLLYRLFLHACFRTSLQCFSSLLYITSGANDTIFINCASRSSRATGPKIRVPLGLLSSRMITAAFSSNRIYEPSFLLTPLLERTITALTISPFLTTPPAVASFTVQTITSPLLSALRPDPPSTFIVNTSRAPDLSATFNRDSC